MGDGERRAVEGRAASLKLNGVTFDAVGDIIGILDKPGVAHWSEDHSVRGGVKAERMGELEGVAEGNWVHRVRALGLGADAARDAAAKRGTAIHLAMRTSPRRASRRTRPTIRRSGGRGFRARRARGWR